MKFASLALALMTVSAYAEPTCSKYMADLHLPPAKVSTAAQARKRLVSLAKAKKIPGFYKKMGNQDVPVLMLTKKTYPDFKSELSESMGYVVELQPNHGTDHGLLRVGHFLMDVDAPGKRNYGEIHDTGLAWKEMGSWFERREDFHNVMIEEVYHLSRQEMSDVQYYQWARKAAIFVVPYSFGGHSTKKMPNMLSGCGEHCFTYSWGQSLSGGLRSSYAKLQESGGFSEKEAKEFLNKAKVKKFLQKAREVILSTGEDYSKASVMNNGMLKGQLSLLKDEFPAGVTTAAAKLEFANWLVAVDSHLAYQSVMKNTGVSEHGGLGIDTNRASDRLSAIFIYDPRVGIDEFFNDASLGPLSGNFMTWKPKGQKPF